MFGLPLDATATDVAQSVYDMHVAMKNMPAAVHSGHIQALVCQFSYSYWGGPALSPALHCQHKR